MSASNRKQLGQYFTPISLARDIVCATEKLYKKGNISVVEPAYGKGAFFYALQENGVKFKDFLGVEIDRTLEKDVCDERVRIINEDFTDIQPDKQYDLLITNPPYTRHQLLSRQQKEKMVSTIQKELGLNVNGLSGLHCYFLLLADKWLKENGIAVWLLPSEFLDVNYGKELKKYLTNHVQLLQIHVYETDDSSLFDNATVSSCVIVYKKKKPALQDRVLFSFGAKMAYPEKQTSVVNENLQGCQKWLKLFDIETRSQTNATTACIADYFHIKRGIATGYNKYFILSEEEIERRNLPIECFTPIIENTRNVSNLVIESDDNGFPIMNQRLFVLNTDLPISEIEERHSSLYQYLLYGLNLGVKNRHLVGKRKIWYKQEARFPAPFYCSYMSRLKKGSPFRFIWNKSNVIVSNNFLMLYPKPQLESALRQRLLTHEDVYQALLHIETDVFAKQARTYAEGLSKLEPTELGKVGFCLQI